MSSNTIYDLWENIATKTDFHGENIANNNRCPSNMIYYTAFHEKI